MIIKDRVDVGKRKHMSQMTDAEINLIRKKLSKVQNDDWKLTGHALDRLTEKSIRATKQDIISTIYNSHIIEYRIVRNRNRNSKSRYDERVILRSKSVVNGSYNLHAVYSLTNKVIVTVWLNHVRDWHSTLDMSIYSKDMKIIGA